MWVWVWAIFFSNPHVGEGEGEGAPAAERAAGAAGEGAPSCGLRVVPSCGCSCQWLQASSFVALAIRANIQSSSRCTADPSCWMYHRSSAYGLGCPAGGLEKFH